MSMLKNKKLMLAVALPILILGIGYKMTRPEPVNKDKIKGTLYVLPAPFLLNLQDGRFAKLTVGLELAPGQSDGASATAAASSGENAAGTLPEEPLVREIMTNADHQPERRNARHRTGPKGDQAPDPADDQQANRRQSRSGPDPRPDRPIGADLARDDRVRAVRAGRRVPAADSASDVDLSRLSATSPWS